MTDMAEETATETPVDEAPAPEAEVAPPTEEAPSEEQSPETEAYTIHDAWREAQAELAAEDAPEAEAKPEPEPEPEAAPEPEPVIGQKDEEPPAPPVESITFDKAMALIQAGRMNELPANALQAVQQWQQGVEQAKDQEQQYHRAYMDLKQAEAEGADEYMKAISEIGQRHGWTAAQTMGLVEWHENNYPGYLENPDGPSVNARQIQQEAQTQAQAAMRDTFKGFVQQLAKEHEVDLSPIEEKSSGPMETMTLAFEAALDKAVKAAMEKELPKIKEAEREAASREVRAEIAATANPPPVVSGEANSDPFEGVQTLRQAAQVVKRMDPLELKKEIARG